jgi:hypothetical protein
MSVAPAQLALVVDQLGKADWRADVPTPIGDVRRVDRDRMIGRLARVFSPGALGLVAQIQDGVDRRLIFGQRRDLLVIGEGEKRITLRCKGRLQMGAPFRRVIRFPWAVVDVPGRGDAHVWYNRHCRQSPYQTGRVGGVASTAWRFFSQLPLAL